MAEVRLVLVSGSLGMAVHGPRSEQALAECFGLPEEDPWCSLAAADLILVQHMVGIPTDLEMAIDAAQSVQALLPEAAAARLVWAGALPLEELPDPTDGLGEIMARHGGWPTGPGTWTLNLGPIAAPGLGTGVALRFLHPDLAWKGWMLRSSAMVTNRRFLTVDLGIQAYSRPAWGGSLSLSHHLVDLYSPECVETTELQTLQARPWVGTELGPLVLQLGPLIRSDSVIGVDSAETGHGAHLVLGTRLQPGTVQLNLFSFTEVSLSSYRYGSTALDGQLLAGRLALRMRADIARGEDAPAWRSPAYGGGFILRAASMGRWRSPDLAAGIVEWRQPITPLLGLALFSELAWSEGLHPGAGAGIRLHLPPRPHNTLRLDIAKGADSWSISAGWGEAFGP
jgi:hypothetical protein